MAKSIGDLTADVELLQVQVQQLLEALNETRKKVDLPSARIQVPIRGLRRHED